MGRPKGSCNKNKQTQYRTCKRCGHKKPLSEYGTKSQIKNQICNSCKLPAQEKLYNSHAERMKAYYERHPEKNPNYISREDRKPKNGRKICIACREMRPLSMFRRKHGKYGGKCQICRGVNPQFITPPGHRKCKRCNEYLSLDNFEGKRRICIKCADKPISGYDVTEYSEKKRCQAHRCEARKKGLIADFTYSEWLKTKEAFNNKCAYCGSEHVLSQDHFIPLCKGGGYTNDNIIPACHMCNSSKSNNDFFEWYPQQPFYSKKREQKILKYLNYDGEFQQLAMNL